MSLRALLLSCACLVVVGQVAVAQQNPAKIDMAGGKLSLKAPAEWKRIAPKVRIIEHEFAVPAVEGDNADGRLTVMAAGGSIQDNIDRWYAQFSQPGGGSTRDKAQVKKVTAAGHDVHLVDVSGTFKDQRGPMAPAVDKPDYRMLAAIIETKDAGNYFIKFYGPEQTVAKNEKAFVEMIEALEAK